MKAQEILGCLIALKGAGMAATFAGATGIQALMNAVPILRPVCWILAATGLVVLVLGLAIAAAGESKAAAKED
jgi:hypothetical protein